MVKSSEGAIIIGKLPCYKCTKMCSVLFPYREELLIPQASTYNCNVKIVCDTLVCRECRNQLTTELNTNPNG